MKRTMQWGAAIATFFVVVCSIQADGPVPFFHQRPRFEFRNPPVTKVPVHIETCPSGPQARLVIPRKFLVNNLNWSFGQRPSNNLVAWGTTVLPWGGLVMGLVLVPVGLGKVKGRRLTVTMGLMLALIGTFFLSQTSRAHPPIGLPPPIQPFKLTGQVTVEVVDEGDAIRLIFNKNQGITTQYGPG